MVTIKRTMLICALSAFCVSPVLAQKAPAKRSATKTLPAPVKVTTVEGITEYKLANGLRVLLFPDQTKQTATVNITYLVGSKFENYGETGMAHLLEHMVFKGSPKHKNIPQELTAHGARPNGTTWLDRTNYYETFAATDENMDWALDLESDRMVNSYIAKAELDKEFSVVRNEMESGENDPTGILNERVTSTMFLWHNYGKSTIGNRADVEKVPIDRLQAFYHKYYQPDNSVLTVSGKFDPAKVLAKINEKFGAIPKPTRVLPPVYTVEPTQDGERQVTLRRVGDVQAAIAGYHVPSGPHPDTQPTNVLIGLLTDQPSGRLYKKLVETKKATEVYGYDYETADPGMAFFGIEVPKDKNLNEAKDIMIGTVETFSEEKPTAPEVERIINKQLKNIELGLNSSERVGLELSEYIAQGDWRLLFYQRDQLKKVTPGDVVRVANKYFKSSNRTLGLFIPTDKPDRAEVPATPDLAAMLKGYTGSQTIAQGEAFDATPTNIQKRLTTTKVGGVTLNMLAKQTRGEEVVANMIFFFGNEASLQGKGTTASLTAAMLNKGTKDKTRQQIQDELDKLKANLGFSGSANSLSVSIKTTKANFPAVLKLVNEILKEATFPSDELEKLKQQRIAGIEQGRSEPTSIAVNELQRYLNAYDKTDPRYTPTIDESIEMTKAVSDGDVKSFYKDFYGASNAYISIIGDFDATQAKTLLTEEYGSWKSPKEFSRLIPKRKDVAAINKNIETPDKANAFFIGIQPLKLSMKDADYPALLMADYIVGGGFLNSRLASRIRQKEGISYGVGSGMSAGYFDQNTGLFQFYAIYAPENVGKLDVAFKEEIDKVIKQGFTDQEVAEAKKGYLQSRSVTLAQDQSLASTLNTYNYYGENIAFWQKLDDAISKLTTAQINAAAKKYYDNSKISIVKAGDFSKKKSADIK
ncbi:insulinase family protein [Mucilaginibacter daejeonensis]|uniref:M16 family metallopeptidase n=1 Tax=Mucilaginibacter daejeonensis TaxID=398049 RepID=UPI001D17B694|nr:pitrilysin family protein [Mucilaginibacter daejeonensis]UEG54556.1 insulinase family protein [Mucilaginibacter daejeonensis]